MPHTMPFMERDPNISGRSSRASNLSNGSRGFHNPMALRSDTHVSSAAGVMSMLRTSTEIGDVASLVNKPSRPSGMNRGNQRRSGGTSCMSISSSHTAVSKMTSNHHGWPSISSLNRSSMHGPMPMPLSLQQLEQLDYGPLLPPLTSSSPLPPNFPPDARSFSLTQATQPPHRLQTQRSLTSLRSQEHASNRPRSPFRYPTRLRRPGYRPSSPALSDITGVQPRRVPHYGAAPRPRAPTGPSCIPYPAMAAPYHQGRNRSAPYVPLDPESLHGHHYPMPRRLAPFRDPARDLAAMNYAAIASSASASAPSSSDPPSAPPTPKDGPPIRVQVRQNVDIRTTVEPNNGSDESLKAMTPLYYDYSEDFHEEPVQANTQADIESDPAVPVSFVQRIKTIFEERATADDASARSVVPPATSEDVQDHDTTDIPDIPELPAEPIAKRITREMILAALDPTSDTPEPTQTTNFESPVEPGPSEERCEPTTQAGEVDAPAVEKDEKRLSVLSAAPSRASTIGSHKSHTDVVDFADRGSRTRSIKSTHSSTTVRQAQEPSTPAPQSTTPSIRLEVTEEEAEQDEDTMPGSFRPLDDPKVQSNLVPSLTSKGSSSVFSSSPTSTNVTSTEDENASQATSDMAVRFSVSEPASPKDHEDDTASFEISEVVLPSPEVPDQEELLEPEPEPLCITPIPEQRQSDYTESPKVFKAQVQEIHVLQPTAVTETRRRHRSAPMPGRNIPSPPTESPHRKTFEEGIPSDVRTSVWRYPPRELPGLKEEPNEDGSGSEMRASTFKFPLKRSADRRRPLNETHASKDSVTKPSFRMSLADTRVIPSLNFSRMDLFSKLNDALEIRASRSMDGAPCDFPILRPSPQRSSSVRTIRDKYRSLFRGLDESEVGSPSKDKQSKRGSKASFATRHEPENALVPLKRSLSPDELIMEVNRLSIPTVQGLTQRLSELLPSFKKHCADEGLLVDETVDGVVDDIRALGHARGLDDEEEQALEEAIVNQHCCNQSRVIEELPESPLANKRVSKNSSITKDTTLSEPDDDDGRDTPVAELEGPPIPTFRLRAATNETLPDTPKRPGTALSSPENSRPWNFDTSYPWAETMPMEIRLPSPARLREGREAPEKQPSRLRLRMSDATNDSHLESPVQDSTVGSATNTITEDTFTGKRGSSKRSIIGSISRKIGLNKKPSKGPFDNSGFAISPDILRTDDRPVDPGDRYPTTGLSPPSAFNLEEVRSFFSDDSSLTQRGGSFRKRLTQLKSKMPPVSRAPTAMGTRSMDGGAGGSVQGTNARDESGTSVHTFDGTPGMSKTEFRARKVLERMKTIMYRGGELIRSLSGRRKPEPRRPEAEGGDERSISVYTGV